MEKLIYVIILLFVFNLTGTVNAQDSVNIVTTKYEMKLINIKLDSTWTYYNSTELMIEIDKDVELKTKSIVHVSITDKNDKVVVYQRLSRYDSGKYGISIMLFFTDGGRGNSEMNFYKKRGRSL